MKITIFRIPPLPREKLPATVTLVLNEWEAQFIESLLYGTKWETALGGRGATAGNVLSLQFNKALSEADIPLIRRSHE